MKPERDRNPRQNWFYRLRDRWDEFTGEIFAYIAQQEAKISREELDKRLSDRRN
jgi:hypothetical protein